jgi:hypothetical protein
VTETAAGTVMVKDIHPGNGEQICGVISLSIMNFILQPIMEQTGDELWKSDGTTSGTVLLKIFTRVISRVFSMGSIK